jgi:N,N'-diacetyllegionaminate synthase
MKIIAEFCQNHNGDFEILREMVAQAAEAGATHGKIQTIFAKDLAFREEFEEGIVENGIVKCIKRPYRPEYDRLSKLEMSYEDHHRFVEICSKAGIIPLTTIFNPGSIEPISKIGFKAIKVASYDCGSHRFINKLSETFKNLIVSTGASYDYEIEHTGKILSEAGVDFSFLHCVTMYPTPLDQMNLARMKYLKTISEHVGLSDHSLVSRDGVKSCVAAIYLGASIVERHFTILPADQTRDGPVSITREDISEIVKFASMSKEDQKLYIDTYVPEFDIMIGEEKRKLLPEEILNRKYYMGRFGNNT